MQSIKLSGSFVSSNVFKKIEDKIDYKGEKVRGYYFGPADEDRAAATQTARAVIEDQVKRKGRVLTFSLDNLEEQLELEPVVIRRGNILSLSATPPLDEPDFSEIYLDQFTFTLVEEPINLSGKRVPPFTKNDKTLTYERCRFEYWLQNSTLNPPGAEIISRDIQDYPVHAFIERFAAHTHRHKLPRLVTKKLKQEIFEAYNRIDHKLDELQKDINKIAKHQQKMDKIIANSRNQNTNGFSLKKCFNSIGNFFISIARFFQNLFHYFKLNSIKSQNSLTQDNQNEVL